MKTMERDFKNGLAEAEKLLHSTSDIFSIAPFVLPKLEYLRLLRGRHISNQCIDFDGSLVRRRVI